MHTTSELGGTVVRGLMVKVGDLLYVGQGDTTGGKVSRIWAVYRGDTFVCAKLTIQCGEGRERVGSYTTAADDPRIQFLPGADGAAMGPGEWGDPRWEEWTAERAAEKSGMAVNIDVRPGRTTRVVWASGRVWAAWIPEKGHETIALVDSRTVPMQVLTYLRRDCSLQFVALRCNELSAEVAA